MRKGRLQNSRVSCALIASVGGVGGFLVPSSVRADFVLDVTPGVTSDGDTDYVISAINNGLHGTGSTLESFDLTISTPGSGTAGALVIDLTQGDEDGALADVDGQTDLNDVTPTFGKTIGTFLGIGSGTLVAPATSTGTTEPHSLTMLTSVKVNGQSAQAVYQTNGDESDLNPAFADDTVHSLEVAGMLSGGKLAASPIPFANVVVPTGTNFTLKGSLEGETGNATTLGAGASSTPASGPFISLTGSIPTDSNSIGTITMVGGHGFYAPASTSVSGPAQTTGYLTVNGYNPVNDKEVYAVALDDYGQFLTSGSPLLPTIISDFNTALAGTGEASIITSNLANAPASTYDVLLTFPTGPSVSPAVLAYNLANYTTNGNLSISQIAVVSEISSVPEPAGLSVLVISGISLLSRRRRNRPAGA